MTTAEIIKKFGVEHYYDEAKTHYIVIPKAISITKEDAMRAANHYFKVNAANLAVWDAWAKGDDLFFQKKMGAKSVWAVEKVK